MRHRSAACAAAALLAAAAAGCGAEKLDSGFRALLAPKRTPQQSMIIAVTDADADNRRVAVSEIAKSKQYDRDWAINGMVAIALLESDPQARCVAIRGLARGNDPRAAETCLKILNYRNHPPHEVRPPDELARWDAAVALAELSDRAAVPEALRAETEGTFLELLRSDLNRHVRIAAARGLRDFPAEHVVEALIDALRDEDFAVVHTSESSLVALTGVTHGCNHYAWKQWAAQNGEQLFANSGYLPESHRPKYRNWYEKVGYQTKELFRWLYPGRKQK